MKKICEYWTNVPISDENLNKIATKSVKVILNKPAIRDHLELFYSELYTITCLTARLLRKIYPQLKRRQLFEFTQALIETSIRLAISELGSKEILKTACPDCLYPIRILGGKNVDISEKKNCEFPTSSPHQSNLPMDPPAPLIDQVKDFIWSSEKGYLEKEIIQAFQQHGFPNYDIHDAIVELINLGEIMQKESGRYTKLGTDPIV